MITKQCGKCLEVKPLVDFHRRGDGRQHWCKLCKAYAQNGIEGQLVRRRYGTTLLEVQKLKMAQENACAICSAPFNGTPPHFDHDRAHCPGKSSCGVCTRGLLCSGCNLGLGHFRDDPDRLRFAAAYIEFHRDRIGGKDAQG